MEFQFHPASRQGKVRSLVLDRKGERALVAAAGVASLLSLSLWLTVPTYARRSMRSGRSAEIARASAAAKKERADLEARVAGTTGRALDAGDLVSRIAFLYRVAPKDWPRSLNAETGVLSPADPEARAQGLVRYLAGLERGLDAIERKAAEDPELAAVLPSMLPVVSDLVEPAAAFGPRVSPWTGNEEFFAGVDLAAPAGAPVVAPADGTVVFAGRVPATTSARLWRFGNLVVLSHGKGGATVFGHLGKVEVRRGARVLRGARLGTVGTSGWAMFPALHYEYWRAGDEGMAPTDPRFAMLDLALARHDVSLEKMRATSAPGRLEPPPGIGR